MFNMKSKIALLVGTLSLVAANAVAGSVDGTQTNYQLEIQPNSITCKKEMVNTGYIEKERDVLRLKATPESAPGVLEHMEFATGGFGGDINVCQQVPALTALLAANQNKVKVTVTFSTQLYSDGAGATNAVLWESIELRLPLGGKTISLNSQKSAQVTK